ncbi:MAG: TetR/AcrR family transcriptional regulator [Alphaproteobacteria bacterium]|nr:TetR/AcrR family transcriptional regulator [Alphaproteobacteria bacterium]
MPTPKLSREEVVHRLTRAFRAFGFDEASLAKLSDATGLGRSSLYHYFPEGKDQMARAVLDAARAWLADNLVVPVSAADTPADKMARAREALGRFYENGQAACFLELFALGGAQAAMGEAVAQDMRAVQGLFTSIAESAGHCGEDAKARGELALVVVQGALVVARGGGDVSVFERALARLPQILLD